MPRAGAPLPEPAMRRTLLPLRADEEGATAIEYALVASLVAAVVAGAVAVLGRTALGLFLLVNF